MTTRRANKESVSSDNGSAGGVSLSDVEGIVNNICHKAVEAAVGVLREEFGKLFDEYNKKLSAFEQRLQAFEESTRKNDWLPAVEDITKRLDDIDTDFNVLRSSCVSSAKMADVMKEVEVVRSESRKLMCAANDAEQYIRRNNLRIRGLAINPKDDCRSIVVSFLHEKLGVNDLNPCDIEAAHILPVRTNTQQQEEAGLADAARSQSTAPQVIVRFRSREWRDTVMRRRRKLKGTQFTVVEDLTALNMQTYNRVRNSSDVVAKCWTWNGKIVAITKAGDRIQVRPFQPLSETVVV